MSLQTKGREMDLSKPPKGPLGSREVTLLTRSAETAVVMSA